jgi:hypothetical protein
MPADWDVGPVAVASDGSRILTFACPPTPATCGLSGRIRIWNRSSNTWHDVPIATDMLTTDQYGHRFDLDRNLSTDGEAASVAIAPHDPNLLAIGTLDVGLLLSADGGASWQRVPMSVGNIDKVWFDNTDRLYVTSYGRGVFGGVVPAPDQLSVTPHRQSMFGEQERWSWTAHLATASGAPVAGAQIRFTLVNDSGGGETEVGYGTTGSDGIAHVSRLVPAGSYRLLARWEPQNGANVETDAHVVAEPTVSITSPSRFVHLDPEIVLRYSGLDPGTKSSLSYDVRSRIASPTGSFGSYQRPKALQGTTSVSQKFQGTPGQEWCFGVRVHDQKGRTSPWSNDRCSALPLDDQALSAGAGWTQGKDPSAYMGTVTVSKTKGSTLRLKGLNGDGIALLVTECPDCGAISIYVGGKLIATQSTSASKTVEHVSLPMLSFKQQVASLTIKTTSDKPLSIDGIAVHHGGGG